MDDSVGYSEIFDVNKVASSVQENISYNVVVGGAAPHDYIKLPEI